MKYTLLFSAAMLAASTSLSMAAEKVYFLNNGPEGSSGHTFYTMMAESMKGDWDIEVLSFDGCSKVVASMGKIGDANIVTDANTKDLRKKESCAPLAPTAVNHMFANQKVGVVFKRADSDATLDTPGVRVAYNKGRNHIVTDIASTDNYIEYKKSSQIIKAVISGEADIGIVNTSAKVYKNDELLPMYNTSAVEVDGVPSLTTIGGGTLSSSQSFIFTGDDSVQESLRDDMAAAAADASSSFGEFYDNVKGQNITLNLSRMDSYTLLANSM